MYNIVYVFCNNMISMVSHGMDYLSSLLLAMLRSCLCFTVIHYDAYGFNDFKMRVLLQRKIYPIFRVT